MLVYAFFSILLIIAYLNERTSSKLMLIILLLFTFLRYNTGWDYNWYYDEVKNIATRGFFNRDLGAFWFYFFKIGKLTGFYWLPLSLIGVITTFLIYHSLEKFFHENDSFIKSALLYYALFPVFYLDTFSVIRQWFALSLCMLVFVIYLKKIQERLAKRILFLALFLITVVFSTLYLHSSSAIMVIFPFVTLSVKYIKNFWWYSLILLAILFVFTFLIDSITANYFPEYNSYVNGVDNKENTGIAMHSFNLILLVVTLLRAKYILKLFNFNLFLILFGIGVVLAMYSVAVVGSGVRGPVRLSYYFLIFVLFIIPHILNSFSIRYKIRVKILFSCIMACWFVLYVYRLTATHVRTSHYVPYETIFIAPK